MKVQNNHTRDITSEKYFNADNIEVYKDTLLKATHYSIGHTLKYFSVHGGYRMKRGEVIVENIDTVGAIVKYSDEPTCVLNMASWKTPGGGVAYGAKAQEEALFRCSNLGLSISVDHYPLLGTATLYTRDAVFFKDKDYNDLPDGYVVDVITSPAIKLEEMGKPENYEELTQDKIEMILGLASSHHIDNLILGAWGCGVYKNDPTFIATAFKNALKRKAENFNRVIFAIINDENSVSNNYQIFKEILNG